MESNILKDMHDHVLKEFHAATIVLQSEGVSLCDVTAVFDSLLSLEGLSTRDSGKNHLPNSSQVVRSNSFEPAAVKFCNGDLIELNKLEKSRVERLCLPDDVQSSDEDLPVAVRAMKKRKVMSPVVYSNVE